jgi:glycosyltransferase involved in cell wall biosynthesis
MKVDLRSAPGPGPSEASNVQQSSEEQTTSLDHGRDFSTSDLSPLLPDVGVIALVPDHWSPRWQPRHQAMTRLARYFPVVWMNPAEDWRRSFELQHFSTHRTTTPVAESGFTVHTPASFWPEFYSPRWLARLSFRKRVEHARDLLLRKGCKKIILYLWRPEFAGALDAVAHDLSCYHIDDEYSFSAVDKPIPEAELNLIKSVDHVFIHSPALLEKKGQINPHTSFAPNGVDFDSHARPVPAPSDIAEIPHPRIGYSGYVKKQLDWPLLLDLTARHPEWSFVFVGASSPHPEIVATIEELSRRKNVRFLGAKTAHELASYPQHFDVCIMPYVVDDYTRYIYPLKLHEYLASGRPVVGAPIASLEAFRHVVQLPATPDQWSTALTDALGPSANSAEARAARQAVAKQHDWVILVRKIAFVMADRLGPSYAQRLAERVSRPD